MLTGKEDIGKEHVKLTWNGWRGEPQEKKLFKLTAVDVDTAG